MPIKGYPNSFKRRIIMSIVDFAAVFSEPTGVLYVVFLIVVCAIGLIASIKIFQKAGKPGWHAIVPILNLYDLFEIAWGKGLMFLTLLIPVVGFVVLIVLDVKLARSFGKGGGFAAGLIFFEPIFMLMLAFGSAEYIGPDEFSTEGPAPVIPPQNKL